ncbi:MAG TPA: hypothetical protein VMB73_32960 [Acetobacteraceae bacterium]|nr:hypothetical protein [Acetobacteraceae bacterium]
MGQNNTLLPPSRTLLPPSGTLAPPSGGAPRGSDSDAAQQFAAQFDKAGADAVKIASHVGAETARLASRAGAEAKVMAGKLAGVAAERLPELREHAAGMAGAAWAKLADAEQRKAFFAANRKYIAGGAVAVAVLAAGGFYFAKQQADETARRQVSAFLLRSGLSGRVSYKDVSGSPFGSATLSNVLIRQPDGAIVAKVGALQVSGLETSGNAVTAVSLSGSGVEIPTLAFIRSNPDIPVSTVLLGLGYTTLKGNASLSFHMDDARQTLALTLGGKFDNFGTFEATVTLGGLTSAVETIALQMANAQTDEQQIGAATLGLTALQSTLNSVSLVKADITVDDSGLFQRRTQITDQSVPTDHPPPQQGPGAADVANLVRAGMDPDAARSDVDAVRGWLSNGGTLHVETRNDSPLPFMQGGLFGGPSPVFRDPRAFLVATRARVTD